MVDTEASDTATDRRTTTIQITNEIWAALDRRKDRGETFDDVIRRLIEATGTGVGALAGPGPDVVYDPVEPVDDDAEVSGCAYYDVIEGETCDAEVVYQQGYQFGDNEDTEYFYYCDEHVPESSGMQVVDL